MTEYYDDNDHDREPMIGVLLSNYGELQIPCWVLVDLADYTSRPEVIYYMTKDLRSYPDMLSWVEENQSILEKVQINVRIQEIPKKMKNHYHIKINEDFEEEIVLDVWSYENYLTQWSRTNKLRYISTAMADKDLTSDEKIKRIEELLKNN
jgi:predicted GIY-YIG superfamily endonuclease